MTEAARPSISRVVTSSPSSPESSGCLARAAPHGRSSGRRARRRRGCRRRRQPRGRRYHSAFDGRTVRTYSSAPEGHARLAAVSSPNADSVDPSIASNAFIRDSFAEIVARVATHAHVPVGRSSQDSRTPWCDPGLMVRAAAPSDRRLHRKGDFRPRRGVTFGPDSRMRAGVNWGHDNHAGSSAISDAVDHAPRSGRAWRPSTRVSRRTAEPPGSTARPRASPTPRQRSSADRITSTGKGSWRNASTRAAIP